MAFHRRTTILIFAFIMLIVPTCGIVEEFLLENAPSLQTIDEGDSFSIWCNFSMAPSAGYTVIWKKVNLLNSTYMRPIYKFQIASYIQTKSLNDFSKRNISVTYTWNLSDVITINCLIRISNASYWDGGNYTCSVKHIGVGKSATSEEYQTVRVIVPPTSVHISQKAVTSTSIIIECVTSYLYPGEHPAHDILWYNNGNLSHVTLAKDLKCNSLNSSLCQSFSAKLNVSKYSNKRYHCESSDIRSDIFVSREIDDSRVVPENAPSLQTIDEGDSFLIWCNFSMRPSPGFTVIWKKVNPLDSTDVRPIYMLRIAGWIIAKPLNDFIGRNISETCTENGSHPITINCLIQISNASYWDWGKYTCYIKPIGYRYSTSVAYQTVRVLVNSTDIPTKWIRIIPESQVNPGYVSIWPILLCAVALFLGFVIIKIIVYNRRKVAYRAVHLPRQNTPTNRRRRRYVRRPGKALKLPFIRFINRFRNGNTDDYHTCEVPERVEENQRNTHIALNESAQELNLNDIELLQNIGHGHFGDVFKAILKTTNAAVAVKLLKELYTEVDKRDFFREIDTMQLVPQHENVVVMLGFCKSAARAFLVLEYLGNGNLKTYLHKSRSHNTYSNLHGGSSKLTSQNILSYALDSAKGMAHISRYKFLHRDLAARNILVSDTMVCKVSDFGLARDVIDSREYLSRMESPLPIRWMAPESISASVYTTKSDVWSFGVLLWEIVTLGATPYPGITSGRELIREIRSGYRMEKPQHCTQELYNMMMLCWEEEPTERPTFDNLVISLRDMANEEIKLHVDVDRAAEAVYCDIDSQLVGEIV